MQREDLQMDNNSDEVVRRILKSVYEDFKRCTGLGCCDYVTSIQAFCRNCGIPNYRFSDFDFYLEFKKTRGDYIKQNCPRDHDEVGLDNLPGDRPANFCDVCGIPLTKAL